MRNHPLFDVIFERRAIRGYEPTPVDQDKLALIVEAGLWAPSASNKQPWHFTVITDPAVVAACEQQSREYVMASSPEVAQRYADPSARVFYNVPCLILISYRDDGNFWALPDTSLAVQNMMLAAHALDLGTCYIGMVRHWLEDAPGKAFLATLPVPEGYRSFGFLALGTPSVTMPKRDRAAGTVDYV